MRAKKCKSCGEKFSPTKPLQSVCSLDCAIKHGRKISQSVEKIEAKRIRKELRDAKEKIKTKRDWIREAQQAFNSFIRARDYGKPCICCGLPTKDGDHAGHWKPTSSSPELRFNEDNVHLQRVQCNLFLHGNVAAYRQGLLQRIGLERVERLEASSGARHYSIDELKEIKQKYSKLARELRK